MAQNLIIVVLATVLASGLALPSSAQSSRQDYEVYQFRDSYQTTYYRPDVIYQYGILAVREEQVISCDVVMPDGMFYNLWPKFNVPEPTISAPHPLMVGGCFISFDKPSPSFSGTYELISLVRRANGSQLLSKIKYHITFIPSAEQDVKAVDNSNNIVRIAV